MLRKFLVTIFLILIFASKCVAGEIFKITSANIDTSNSMIVLNVQDTQTPIMNSYKPVVLENPKRVYFDINDAILTFPKQDWLFSGGALKEVKVSQFSNNPYTARVVIYVEDNFNVNNIKLMRVKNNLIIKFKDDILSNDYFHNTYRDEHSSSADFYEYMTVATPDIDGNAVRKETKLNTGYYMQNAASRQDAILINGFGALTIERPMILTNPSRIVFDLSNTLTNPKIRNNEYRINATDSVKIGQFSVNKARVVITTENVHDYIPIYSEDNQSLIIANFKKVNTTGLYKTTGDVIAYNKEKIDAQTSTMLLSFSAPVVHGVDRTKNELVVYLYNIGKYSDELLKKTFVGTPFAKAKVDLLPKVGLKLTVPLVQDTMVSTYLSADNRVIKVKVQEPKVVAKPPVTVTPKGKSIVIDPGHGGSDHGAIRNNVSEKDINLDVSKRVAAILKKAGYSVCLTRQNDIFVSLEDRVAIAEKVKPDVFVSVHVNSSVKPEIDGIETHYYHQESYNLAQTVHSSLASAIKSTNRGLFQSKFYVINHTTMPAILVEIGFISNDAERAQLVSPARKEATAKAIAEGVMNYFK